MKKLIALLGSVTALGFAVAPASAATVVPIGTNPPAVPYFDIKYATPTDSIVVANFGDTITGSNTAFDDKFEFILPLSGLGSGSVSTSFSGAATLLTITQVIINGMTVTPAAAALGINGIPITAGALNTIEIIGKTGSVAAAGSFDGTATFQAAVPEPATWATFLLGFGFLGLGLRRRTAKNIAVA